MKGAATAGLNALVSRLRGAVLAPLVLATSLVSVSSFAQPASAPAAPRFGEAYGARVTRVPDGDTLWVRPLAGGKYRKLRLDGVDAPEICQPGGTAARDALAARVLEQTVTVTERRRDDYGRALVRLNGWVCRL